MQTEKHLAARLLPLLAALAVLCSLSPMHVWAAEDVGTAELDYAAEISMNLLEETDTGFRLEIVNPNGRVHGESLRRITKPFFVLTTPRGRCDVELEEVEWRIEWDDEVEGPLALDSESTAGPVPTIVQRPSARYMDDVRTLGFAQVKATITTAVNSRETPGRRGTAVVERMVLSFDLGEDALADAPGAEPLSRRDPYLLQYAAATAVNAVQAERLSRDPDPDAALSSRVRWAEALEQAQELGPVLLYRPWREGVYRIDLTDLSRTTGDASALDPRRLRVFVGDEEIPVIASNATGASFVNATELLAYIPPKAAAHHPHVPVWLMETDEEIRETLSLQEEPRRIGPPAIPPADSPQAENPVLKASINLFRPNEFRPDSVAEDTGRWSLALIPMQQTENFEFTLRGVDPEVPASLRASISPMKPQESVSIEFYLNGRLVGGRDGLAGRGPYGLTLDVPPGVLRDGENTLAAHYPESLDARQGGAVYLNGATIDYNVRPDAAPVNERLLLEGGAPGRVEVVFERTGDAGGIAGILLDVTNRTTPERIQASAASLTSDGATFRATVERSPRDRALFFSDPGSLSYLGNGREVSVENVADGGAGVDYLVVAHEDAMPAARRLAAYREGGARRTKVVDIEDVEACFGFGQADSLALHSYLRYAFTSFPGRRLSQVVLVGEASDYWWPLEHPRSDVSPNQVPIYAAHDPRQKVRGDNGYGLLAGSGDMQDIQIGRIPAATGEELDAFIDRLIDYETSPPEGPWRSRHIFVTDDEPEFARVAERLIRTELTGVHLPQRIYLQDFPYEDYFRIFLRKRSSEMTRAIVDALSGGAMSVTYLGHGGPNLWSGERIFHYRDLPLVNNGGRRPIMAAASCDTAWIDYPVDPVKQSLGEQFILTEDSGGMAVFAPVAGTSSFEHDFLIRPFYKALLDPRFEELGFMAEYAKAEYLLERNQGYVSEQFILLGDPATRPPRPSGSLNVQASPTVLFSSQSSTLSVEGEAPSTPWGMAEIELISPLGERAAGPHRVPVRAGRFSAELQTPPFLRAGDYRVVVQAWNTELNSFETVSYPLPVLEPQVEVSWDSDPPVTEMIEAGTPVRVELQALNSSDAPIGDVLMTIRDRTAGDDLTSQPILLQPNVMRRWSFEVPAPSGVLLLEARVEYADAAPGQEPITTSPFELRGVAPDAPPVQVLPELAEVTRIAAPEQTIFDIPVYNVSPNTLTAPTARLMLMDTEQGTPVGGELRGEAIPPRGMAVFQFRADSLFPEGDLPFRLILTGTMEGTEESMESVIPLSITIPAGTDLAVLPGSVRAERDDYVQGQTVYVRATVANLGRTACETVRTSLFVDYPWVDSALAESNTQQSEIIFDEPLLPGERRDVRLRWDPSPSSNLDARLYVVVNSDSRTPEVNLRNNVGDVLINRLRLPNLALAFDRIELSRRHVAPGELVNITVPYVNNSPFDFAHPFIVEVNVSGQGAPPRLVYRGTFDGLEAAEEGLIQAAWRADGMRNTFVVSLNEDREYGETTAGDNIASESFDYIFPLSAALQQDETYDFSDLFEYGDWLDSYIGPRGNLTVRDFPRRGRRISFSNDIVVGDPLPPRSRLTEADNRIALTEDGSLRWTPFEQPDPIRLRIPMDADDGTTLYDIHVYHLGENNIDDKPYSHYQYRFEDEQEWTDNSTRGRANAYMARVETKDDWLDMEIGPTRVPAWNLIIDLEPRPLRGVYVSPILETLREGGFEFAAEHEAAGSSRIEYEYRLGSGQRTEPGMGEWTPIAPGDRLDLGRDTRFLQWRITMTSSRDHAPTVRRFGLRPFSPEVASVTESE